MSSNRNQVLHAIRTHGHRRLPEPVELASGALSRDFVDAKRALAAGSDLAAACRAMAEEAAERGIQFDAVGGMTMGADQFAHGMAVLTGCSWFVVRKQAKDRGTRQRVEGALLGPGVRVLLVEDVVSTGGSAVEAAREVMATGAEVVLALSLVDRGEAASERFADLGVPYATVLTYRDLGIEPVVVPG